MRLRPKANAGFNLLEVMVGLLIASVSLLLIMQVLLLFEEQKRSMVAGDDAESVGAMGFYAVQRDVRQGGYGVSALSLMGCDVLLPAVAGRANISFKAMAPVTINSASIPPGDPNTDTVLVVYGNSQGGPEGNLITAHVTGANTYTVDSARSFSVGDLVIAGPQARPSPCLLALDRVNGVDNVLNKVTVSAGAPGNMINGRLYNLGQAPKMLVYAIRGGNLTLCDYMANDCGFAGNVGNPAVWLPVAGNIVSLRAQYGRDTTAPNMDGIVDVYDQASPATSCDWARVAAVRLVLVARNSQPAKTGGVHNDGVVTDAAPAWAGSANNPVDLSATEVPAGFSWQNYRYKTFETVISIRNMAQSGAQAGC